MLARRLQRRPNTKPIAAERQHFRALHVRGTARSRRVTKQCAHCMSVPNLREVMQIRHVRYFTSEQSI